MLELLLPYLIFLYINLGAFMLFSKKKENLLLSVYFYLLSFRYVIVAKNQIINPENFITYYSLEIFSVITCIVCLYLYIDSILSEKAHDKKWLLGIVPIVVVGFLISCYIADFSSTDELQMSTLFMTVKLFYFMLMSVLYISLMVRINRVFKHNALIYTSQQYLLLSWVRFYFVVQLLMVGAQSFILVIFKLKLFVADYALIFEILDIYWQIITPVVTLLALSIAYFVLRNPLVFERVAIEQMPVNSSFEQKLVQVALPAVAKNTSLKITDALFDEVVQKITASIEIDKLYLNPSITIKELATATHFPVNTISFVLNKHWNMNVKDLMNEYRVEHAKKMLLVSSAEEIKNYAIALESGFNSESSFYLVFKKKTGLTPIVFRAQFGSH